MTERKTILLLGATGLFGGLLAKRIVREGRFELIAAGRGEATLRTLQADLGISYRVMDRDDARMVESTLKEVQPFAVVDCAGPFQYYGDDPYRFARQVIEAGAHYTDIADASTFVAGIGELDALAKEAGVSVISGASSTPAISAAVLDHLTADLTTVEAIETAIIPGNRARRTHSVMKAVLGQVGQAFLLRRHGKRETVYGWDETISIDLDTPDKPPVRGRLASFVDTPDVALFPERYKANTVLFRAGLEVKTFHRCLSLGRMLVKAGIVKSLAPFSGFARWLASWFEWVGSDEGGMQVKVLGTTKSGERLIRHWDLIADDGRGPEIPTIPISILLNRFADAAVDAGARASPGEVTLPEVEAYLETIEAKTAVHEQPFVPVFQSALGQDFDHLPAPIHALHNQIGQVVFEGEASTEKPTGFLGAFASAMVGFPKAESKIPVRVTLTVDENGETWLREFDGKPFHSRMSLDDQGFAQETFGPLSMRLGLKLEEGKLYYPVARGRVFGFIPVPKFLLPKSISHEAVDEEGRFTFDVRLETPFGGRIAHYKGWLEHVDGQ